MQKSVITAIMWGWEGRGGGGGEVTLLYQLFRYVPSQRVCFLSRFGLKTDVDFDHLHRVWISLEPRERINVCKMTCFGLK